MAELLNGQVKLNSGQTVVPSEGAWYDGRRYLGGQLLNPGEYEPGKLTSPEVIAQTNPQNVKYIEEQRTKMGLSGTSTPGGAPNGAGAGASLGSLTPAPTINLPDLYKNLYAASGIDKIQEEYSNKEKSYNDAISKINDNPYLTEATRTGRLKKLETDFLNSTASLKNDIAVKKADLETQLGLETKQFDINSQVARDSLNQFNTLLDMGALKNISGEDIASLTRSTGLSSSMITSAIESNKSKNTQVIQYDDGTNQGFVVIDNAGNIINRNVIAPSDRSGGGLTTTQQRGVTSDARTIVQTVDEQYRTLGGKAKKLEFEEDYGGDKRISAQEYIKAVEMLMAQSGIDEDDAAGYITQAMKDLGYTNWSP